MESAMHPHILLILLLNALMATPAWADRDEYERPRPLANQDAIPLWKQECGSCHLPFPPAMLPAKSWRDMMANLKQHFGEDASLSPEETRTITAFLAANGGRRPADAKEPLRITRTAWFRHEHGEIRADVWQRPTVKTPANCQACHRQAEKGDFSERGIRIPR